MKITLIAANPHNNTVTPLPRFTEIAHRDRFGVHKLEENPQLADLILFVDAHQHQDFRLSAITGHPVAKKHLHKTMVYDERDTPWCAVTGLYASMPKSSFNFRRQKACAYHSIGNDYVLKISRNNPDLLFSYMGANSHKIRKRIVELSHSRSFVEDTSSVNFWDFTETRPSPETLDRQRMRFAEIMSRSKFVLCPRGAGTSSIRLFECLAAGRVPVIISDEWVAPSGPDWNSCSIRIAEAEIEKLPLLLEAQEDNFSAMSECALQTYNDWFAEDVMFHRLMENCQALLEQNQGFRSNTPDRFNHQYLTCAVKHARRQVGNVKKSFLKKRAA